MWTTGCSPAASGAPSCDRRLLFDTGGVALFGVDGLTFNGMLNDIRFVRTSCCSAVCGEGSGDGVALLAGGGGINDEVLRPGARIVAVDQVDGSGRSPTNDSGRSPSTSVAIGGGVEIFESCFSATVARALRFGSLWVAVSRLGGDSFRGGDGVCWFVAGSSAMTEVRFFAGDVFIEGDETPIGSA